MKKSLLIFYMFILIINCGISHKIFAQRKAWEVPKKYINPAEDVGIVHADDPTSPQTIWLVFSDRANNPAYASPNSQSPSRTLAFLEELTVVSIQGKRLEVTEPSNILNGRLISGRPTFFVDQDKLLMWSRCLTSLPYRFNKKAMVLNVWKEDNLEALKQKPQYYDSPSTQGKVVEAAGTYQIRYVYKETPTHILVGTDPNFNFGQASDTVIIGWVPTTHITPWDHRVAWELNWFPAAANEREWFDERNRTKRGVIIFDDMQAADEYAEIDDPTSLSQFQKVAYIETPVYRTRQPGKFDRFPILNDDQEIAGGFDKFQPQRIGIIGNIETAKGVLDKEKMISLQQEVIEIEKNQRKINVIFVIDATYSMEIYSESVGLAIDSAMKFINKEQEDKKTRNAFRFGAVLYRDEAEDNPYQIHSNQLTEDINGLGQWIKEYMSPEFYGKDKDLPEAVYYGMDKALSIYVPNPKQTNYLIVIGDAGDHQNPARQKTFVQEAKLITKLADRNINLLAYQVHRPDKIKQDTTYRVFEKQMKYLMLGTAQKIQERDARQASETNLAVAQPIQIIQAGNSNSFRLSPNSPVFGNLKTPHANDSITADTLRRSITTNIKTIHGYINEKITEIASLLEGDSINSVSETTASIVYDLLANGTSIDDIEKILSEKRQIYKEGFTVFQNGIKKYPNFQNVIFIEQTELNSLKETIRNLVLATNESQSPNIIRNRVATSVKEIFESYIGNLSEQEVNAKPFGDLLFIITGLPTKENYRQWTINKVKDPADITDDELMEFSRDMRLTLMHLTQIIETGSNYKSMIREVGKSNVYYWIPGDVFPHDEKPDETGAGI